MAGSAGNGGGMSAPAALCIFVVVLFAYTLQTELAQIVQQVNGYRKPYFLFYMTHSGYILLAPLHILTLRILNIPITKSLYTLKSILELQYAPPPPASARSPRPPQMMHRRTPSGSLSRASLPLVGDEGRPAPTRRTSLRRLLHDKREHGRREWIGRMAWIVVCLSVLIAIPALSWYAAMPLTAVTDITAIYNCFAFWAYLLAIRFLGEAPSRSKLVSVVIAIAGVFVIAYGDAWVSSKPEGGEQVEKRDHASRLIGNLLAFGGSVSYAWYEVWYKMNVSLPDPEDDEADDLDDEDEATEANALLDNNGTEDDDSSDAPLPSPVSATSSSRMRISMPPPESLLNPSPDIFLLYSNTFTSLIGLTTLLLFWIPIPIFHWIGWEEFELPPASAWLLILGIVLSGVVFNGGFMVLLSVWGPVVASVGNLCTLVLVAIADTFVPNSPPLSLSSILGSALIVASFAMLIVGAKREEASEQQTKS
ncbi:hypothetical protein OIV83_006373 [Microbotryomycetes sp. JL201]|nr:hypothetical protein OIV83_006373 [Microbotryomycetes sp. JL201]